MRCCQGTKMMHAQKHDKYRHSEIRVNSFRLKNDLRSFELIKAGEKLNAT